MSRSPINQLHLIHKSLIRFMKYTPRARGRPGGPPGAKVRGRIVGGSFPQWSLTHFWPSCGGLCSLLTSLLLYVGHFFQILLKLCYFLLFFNITNRSFSLTLSTFLTFSYFQLVIFYNILFLSIFGHFGTSRDIKMRCTGPVFLPFGRSLGGFGGVLVSS